MVKRRKTGGASVPLISKQQVLQDPMIKQALKSYIEQQGGAGKMRMKGMGWWEDFVGFLKKNKVVSTASKIGAAIANATGYVPLGTALGAVSTGASALGYGRKMRGGEVAQSIAMPSSSSATPHLKW